MGTSAGTHATRPVAYVHLVTEEGGGWGEVAALPRGTAVDPPLTEVWAELEQWAIPRLFEATAARSGVLPPAAQVAALFGTSERAAAARHAGAALEMAVLDAELRLAGRCLAERLGASATEVPTGALVGVPPDHSAASVLTQVDQALAAGATRIRLKIEPGWDEAPVAAVRRAYPDLALQVDANGAYAAVDDPADALAALDPYGLACLEQPLRPADLPGHAALAERLSTPIALDESLTTRRRLVDAIRYAACRVACLKPARLGGLLAAREAQDLCRAEGIPAFVGGFFETGLARSANLALAALPGFSLAGDLAPPASYLDGDPCGYPALSERTRTIAVPTDPGVGPPPLGTPPAERRRHPTPGH